ncbi:hypothetical protein F2P81_004014 [Scophthalmus maximus]|uniref:Kinesin motor domain-containing protein n=1 Tax=Scophthalmus maximus TaxID=52904 RepID=A0A6A4T8K4_SCOMX|nr:hypothetical protein F2P81_004014 [Scophthalmus maximus]
MNPDGSGQLYVPGLSEFTVQSPEDINRVFELGHMNRATACTNLNEHSSRSHALLIITVCGFNSATGNRTQGKLNLVDLAGSERIGKSGAEGSRLREAQCINKSLSALGDVINALRSKHSHVPTTEDDGLREPADFGTSRVVGQHPEDLTYWDTTSTTSAPRPPHPIPQLEDRRRSKDFTEVSKILRLFFFFSRKNKTAKMISPSSRRPAT